MILVIFFKIFQLLEIKKNNNYNEKRKKKFGAEILKGYCPVCIVREKEEKKLYCRNSAGLVAIQNCIAG